MVVKMAAMLDSISILNLQILGNQTLPLYLRNKLTVSSIKKLKNLRLQSEKTVRTNKVGLLLS